MADSDKDILITPNTGVASTHPKITFTGKDNSPVDLKILDDNTLSFEGAQGQVFSISPTLNSGDIFSVNDISGIQSMAINADGTITMNAQTKSVTITNSASDTSTLILENTNADEVDGPILEFYRNTASPADGGDAGTLLFTGQDDGGNKQEYGRITMEFDDVSNSGEEGELIFRLTEAGAAEQEYMRLRGSSRQIEFNTGTDDIDMVWNSDSASDVFYCNAGTSRVGIKTNAPETDLNVNGTIQVGMQSGLHTTLGNNALQFSRDSTSYIDQVIDNGDISFRMGSSSTNLLWLDGAGKVGIGTNAPSEILEVAGNIQLNDNNKLKLGTGGDLEIYHDGSNSYVNDGGTGDLILAGTNVKIMMGTDAAESGAVFNDNGAVTLYHNNSAKFATTATGAEVTGEIKTSLGNINSCVSFVYNRSDMGTGAVNLKAVSFDGSSSQNHWGFIMPKSGTVKYFTINTRNHTVTGTSEQTWKINNNNDNSSSGEFFQIAVARGATQDDSGVSGSAEMELTQSPHSSTIWRGSVVVNHTFDRGDEIRIQRTNAGSTPVDMGDTVGVIYVEFD